MNYDFYVYGYYHPTTNTLFYVGKGSGKRAYRHLQPAYLKQSKTYLTNTINKIKRLYGLDPIIKILHDGLTEDEGFEIEQKLIEEHGRKAYDQNGTLTNMSTGGVGGRRGIRHSVATRLKMSKARKGKAHSAKHSANIANALKGSKLTEERKQKISKTLTGRKLTKEHKENLKNSQSGGPSTTWKLMSPEGIIFETSNLKEFCKKYNLSYTGIYKNKNKPIVRGIAKGWMTIEKFYTKSLNQLK